MRLAKGTRAKIIHPFFNHDRIGDVFEVAECNSESITLNRCYSDSRSYMQASYTLPTEEFGNFFEVIGMEEPKKDKKNAKSEGLLATTPKPNSMISGVSQVLTRISKQC